MRRTLAPLHFAVTLAFVAAPILSPSFRGYDPAAFPVSTAGAPVQPAGYAFAIWGLLYPWLLIHAAFGLVQRPTASAWAGARGPMILSLGIGAGWLAVARHLPDAATVLIWGMAAAAVAALARSPAIPDRWVLRAPVAAYAGWLTAATGVATGISLTGHGWLSPTVAALVALAGVTAVALAVQMRSRAPEYGAAVIWALIGIIVTAATTTPIVAIAAILAIWLLLAAIWAGIAR